MEQDGQYVGCFGGNLKSSGAFLVAQTVKNPSAVWETGFDPWVGKIPWRREWLPTSVFWPGEFHGQRSLADYNPWGHKELDLTEQLSFHFTSASNLGFQDSA